MNVPPNTNNSMAGLANIGIAAAFGAILVNAEQTFGAFLEAGQKERSSGPAQAPEEGEKNATPVRGVSDNAMTVLQSGRAFILVCLFGIFFMCTATPLVSKKRVYPMRSFTYLLIALAVMAFGLQVYMMRSIKTGLSEGDRAVRFYTSAIYMIFLLASTYILVSF